MDMAQAIHSLAVPQAIKQRAVHQWQNFAANAERAAIDLPDTPVMLAGLPRVWILSEFVAKSCIQDPSIIADLWKSGDLINSYKPQLYRRKLRSILSEVSDGNELEKALRRNRRREMVRIAWRDIAGLADLRETMADLSALAEANLEEALEKLHAWQSKELGIPCDEKGEPQSMVIIGMGKLGAGELNFSSDIDLIFAYPEPGNTRGGSRRMTNEEYFARLGRRLIKTIGSQTAEGFVFRVDMRLRPYGDSGPLAMSFDAMEEYYQNQGRDWERYAWIKAGVVAGDRKAGRRLQEIMRPFVYRRYPDFGLFDALREMKKRIVREVQRKELGDDIKLGAGGIREVEFIGQAFQLLKGGREPDLQERSILRALDRLGRHGLIPENVCRELQNAYVFLRNSEHRLQEFDDKQTQSLPGDEAGRFLLAFSMGYLDWNSYKKKLRRHMNLVHEHFDQLFATGSEKTAGMKQREGSRESRFVWDGSLDKSQVQDLLASLGFDDPAGASGLLDDLRENRATKLLTAQSRRRLDAIMPLILDEAGCSERPTETLRRLIRLVETVLRRSIYLALLIENPSALSHLVKLCAASPWIASFVKLHPVVLDELLDPRSLYAPPGRNLLEEELRKRLLTVPASDLELQMDELRNFKQANVLRVAAADIVEAVSIMKVSDHLTWIAEVVVQKALELAWNHLAEKHGRPECGGGVSGGTGFVVLAYGKFGGIELGYDSDLDLVFMHAGASGTYTRGAVPLPSSTFYIRLGQRLIHILTSHTPAGVLYPVDMRLRPSGEAGVLVTHIRSFEEYIFSAAWTWEYRALVRARPVAGDPALSEKFLALRRRILAQQRDPLALKNEVVEMRNRIQAHRKGAAPGLFNLKFDPGGMLDIEFLVQHSVLLHAHRVPDLLNWTDNFRLLETMSKAGLISTRQADTLKGSYLAFRKEAHRLSLQNEQAVVPRGKFKNMRRDVIRVWNEIIGK